MYNKMDSSLKFLHLHLNPQGKQTIVGSATDKNVIYSADIDVIETVTGNITDLTNEFIDKYKHTPKNIFITDFKCGNYKGYSIKWQPEEVLAGYKVLDNKILYLGDALQQSSRIKLDIIVYSLKFPGEFKFREFSSIYLINENYNPVLLENKNVLASLFNDVARNVAENNLLKAVKRMYSFAKLNNLKDIQKKCLKIINDPTVIELYKTKTQLEITLNLYPFKHLLTRPQIINLIETTQMDVSLYNKREIENKLELVNTELNSIVKNYIMYYKLNSII